MAPYPEEIDVFSVPHSRMKQLVDVYSEKLMCTNFADYIALESLLEDLHNTFCEFKSHEQIENKYIMRKLKKRLKSLSIHDAAVCNCHSDNRLSDMLALLEDGYSCSKKPEAERVNFGIKLQNALQEFTGVFLPHMREEEEVFQPMLMKYFEYEELKCLKEQVIQEHTKWCTFDLEKEETSKKEACKPKPDAEQKFDEGLFLLPPEILSHIFSFLSPLDIIRCSEVCHSWYDVTRNPSLWKELYPCFWAHGIWSKYETNHEDAVAKLYPGSPFPPQYYQDEDADVDEFDDWSSESDVLEDSDRSVRSQEVATINCLIKFLLPKVGSGVQKINLSLCRGLTSTMLREILILCPNVVHLDLSYTCIADSSFKGLKEHFACMNLQYLDFSGCKGITDLGLYRIAESMAVSPPSLPDGSSDLRDVYLENCCQLSNTCLCSQNDDNGCSEIEDSVCFFQRRQLQLCGDCSTSCFCNSVCFWKKNGFMCHLARRIQQCPYVNSCLYSNEVDISFAANQVLRTTATFLSDRKTENSLCVSNCSENDGNARELIGLKYLNLSGCKEITDEGLICLAEVGLFSQLRFLDVSGCWHLTGSGLCSVVSYASHLLPENIYYCNRIEDGPYPESANGCQNLENEFRACCCNSFCK